MGRGLFVGVIPLLGALFDWPLAQNFEPATLLAFFTAAGVYLVLAAVGLEQPLVALPDLEQEKARSPGGETPAREAAATTH